jgi:galactose mutarotase-like enzyme
LSDNTLHGGHKGWSHKFWTCEEVPNGVRFNINDPAGTEGFPGEVSSSTIYTLVQNDRDETKHADLYICMQATLERGEHGAQAMRNGKLEKNISPICMTNHTYFNLAGHDSTERAHKNVL